MWHVEITLTDGSIAKYSFEYSLALGASDAVKYASQFFGVQQSNVISVTVWRTA
jgi:hypothetical protein